MLSTLDEAAALVSLATGRLSARTDRRLLLLEGASPDAARFVPAALSSPLADVLPSRCSSCEPGRLESSPVEARLRGWECGGIGPREEWGCGRGAARKGVEVEARKGVEVEARARKGVEVAARGTRWCGVEGAGWGEGWVVGNASCGRR